MSEAFHGAEYCWMNGRITETEEALVSAMEPIYLGIFEGIKAYVEGDVLGEGRLNIIGWKPHIDRLWRSAAVNGLEIAYTKEEMLEATRDTIKANGFSATKRGSSTSSSPPGSSRLGSAKATQGSGRSADS
jgi:branched-subunit amino acid aminotransferase/4-amino-4-deoxychorismate lyase